MKDKFVQWEIDKQLCRLFRLISTNLCFHPSKTSAGLSTICQAQHVVLGRYVINSLYKLI